MKGGFVYIMTNKKRGVLYIGVTSWLQKRTWEHNNTGSKTKSFVKRYNLTKLVYFEQFEDIQTAILYEKKFKNLSRAKKIEIIERINPEWNDLTLRIAA